VIWPSRRPGALLLRLGADHTTGGGLRPARRRCSVALALKLLALPALLGFCAFPLALLPGCAAACQDDRPSARAPRGLPGRHRPQPPLHGRQRGRSASFRTSRPLTSSSALRPDRGIRWRSPDGQRLFRYSTRRLTSVPPSRSRSRSRSRTRQQPHAASKWDPRSTDRGSGLSVEHVYDSSSARFPGRRSKPSTGSAPKEAHFLFIVFVLLPALCLCVDSIRPGLGVRRRPRRCSVLSPILGSSPLCSSRPENHATESRRRLFILVAIQFYRSFGRVRS